MMRRCRAWRASPGAAAALSGARSRTAGGCVGAISRLGSTTGGGALVFRPASAVAPPRADDPANDGRDGGANSRSAPLFVPRLRLGRARRAEAFPLAPRRGRRRLGGRRDGLDVGEAGKNPAGRTRRRGRSGGRGRLGFGLEQRGCAGEAPRPQSRIGERRLHRPGFSVRVRRPSLPPNLDDETGRRSFHRSLQRPGLGRADRSQKKQDGSDSAERVAYAEGQSCKKSNIRRPACRMQAARRRRFRRRQAGARANPALTLSAA